MHRATEIAAERGDAEIDNRHRASRYTRRSRPYWSAAGTGELLLDILTQDDGRAANLLRALGVPPAQVRVRLRAR